MPSSAEGLLDELIAANVLELSTDGERLGLSEGFRETVERRSTAVADAGEATLRREIEAVTTETRAEDRDVLVDVGASDPAFVAKYLGVQERVRDRPIDEVVRLVFLVDQFVSSPPSDGVPDGFLPIHHGHVGTAIRLCRLGVVYVWRRDCPPCDRVREHFEAIFPDGSEDVSLFAVYGPAYAESLRDEYDVGGAPTTLFVGNGAIDSRLVGAHARETFEREVRNVKAVVEGTRVER
jgi:thiol-disulfide isomerase/thioredoxin